MPALRIKFKQSKDYTYEQLIRDLIEFAQEMDKQFAVINARLAAAGIP